jgi:hypothetical protein
LDGHPPLPTAHIFQYYNTPGDHIPEGCLVEHCPNLLHAEIFAYKGSSLRRHEFATTLNDLFMGMPAPFKYTRTCIPLCGPQRNKENVGKQNRLQIKS